MKISIGFDHGALSLRAPVIEKLAAMGHEVIDHGTDSTESVDYPDLAKLVTADVIEGQAELGILCCTTGIGMSMAANKVKGIRAALVHYEDEAALTRRHNHANVLCLGALHTTPYEAMRLIETFLANEPEGGRHGRRVDKFTDMERNSCI
ncbi:MAG TPA: ribose 5-phosphate isomerase B [Oceanipulchritudo sp.]|nr:ribose 5-phosphate isomerase B [Oceanipulchritudo sp.]